MAHPIHSSEYQYVIDFLSSRRKELGLMQSDVADRLKKPQSFVSKYENNARRLDVIELLHVLAVLDCKPHDFIDYLILKITESGAALKWPVI